MGRTQPESEMRKGISIPDFPFAVIVFAAAVLLAPGCWKKNQVPDVPSILGPSTGCPDRSYEFRVKAEDPDADSLCYRLDWGDGDTSNWSPFAPSGDAVWMSHSWSTLDTYRVKAQAMDAPGTVSEWSESHPIVIAMNLPPATPAAPSGPTTGRTDSLCTFTSVTTDPNADSLCFRFDWGDGDTSDWSVWVRSDDTAAMCHSWATPGTCSVRTQARDEDGAASSWSEEHLIGVVRWNRIFGGTDWDRGHSVQQTSDGGYIIAGETWSFGAGYADVWLIKTDKHGNRTWDKTLGGTNYDHGRSVQQTADGGFIVAGYTGSYGAGHHDFWLVKTDGNGNHIWDRTFGGAYYDEGHSVQQTLDGGYIIVGRTWSYGAGFWDVWLVKTDGNGNHVWDKTFGGIGWDEGHSVQQTADGGYVIAGYTQSFGSDDVWLIKTDENGDKIWDKVFGGSVWDASRSVQQTPDGGYIIATGYVGAGSAGGDDVWLIKTDANGDTIWTRTYGGADDDEGSSVALTADGGYVIAGETHSFGAGSYDIWLIKTDANGTMVWDRTFGGASGDRSYSVWQTSDRGYVITGETWSSGAGKTDILLIRTD